jgi:hypothetical protein
MDLPDEYRDQLQSDLQKPKNQQQLSEDFFIELERSLKTVERALPEALIDKNEARDVLIEKYKRKIIPNLVDLRYIPKIARASTVSADSARAVTALRTLFKPNDYSPERAYAQSVSEAYTEREVISRIEAILGRLEELDPRKLEPDFRDALQQLLRRLAKVLGRLS